MTIEYYRPKNWRSRIAKGLDRWCSACDRLLPATERYWGLDKNPDSDEKWEGNCKICMLHRKPIKSTAPAWMPKRECVLCRDEKKLSPRYWHADPKNEQGYDIICKACRRARRKQLAERAALRRRTVYGDMELPEWKVCRRCGKKKSLAEFGVKNQNRDGRRRTCRECVHAWQDYQKRRKAAQEAARG